ncbi:MAG: 6-phosphofructokinase, partial [Hungatella sp.]
EVMLYERIIPKEYINERGNDVTEEFVTWCKPLIGPELRDFIDFHDYMDK